MKRFISFILTAAMLAGSLTGLNILTYAETVTQTLIDIDENMTFTRNQSTWNMNWTSGTGTVEYADYTRTMETAAYVSEDGSSLVIPQTLSTAYQQRFIMSDPNEVTLNKPVTIETKFKLAADDYDNVPTVQMFLYGLTEVRTPSLELSKELEDTERTLKYVIDPSAGTITGYLDGTEFKTVSYTVADSVSGTWGIFVHVQNKDAETLVEKEELESTVTWTYNSMTLSKEADVSSDTQTQTLIDIDESMTFTRNQSTWNMNWTSGTGTVEYADYTRTMETAAYVSEDGSSLVIPQTVSSAYQQRFIMSNPNEVTLDNPVTLETKFKLAADDYDNAPTVQMFLYGLTEVRTPSLELSEALEDTERTLKYVIDPSAGTITGYLDGTAFKTVSYTAADSVSGTWGIFVHVQNKDAETVVEKETLESAVTWTYNSMTLSKEAEVSSGTQTLIDIDESMTFARNSSTWNMNWTSGTGTVEYADYTRTMETAAYVSEDGSSLIIPQTLSTAYQQRFIMSDPNEVTLDKPVTLETKFKLATDDYDNVPTVQMLFYGLGTEVRTPSLELSEALEDTERTLKYVIDPSAGTITGYFDGTAFNTVSYTAADSISGTWGIFVHVQNKDTETAVEKETLESTVTWTYNSFTMTKETEESDTDVEIPEDDAEYVDPGIDDSDGLVTKQIVYIDDDMQYVGSTLSQDGSFDFLNWTGGTPITTTLENNDIFKMYQTKSSKWGQRLRLLSPEAIALDSKTVFKMRFKCTADDYTKTLPRAHVMLDTNGLTTYVVQFNSDVTVLSPTKKDVWRTLLYTIDPEAETIVVTLDGETVATSQITDTDAISMSQASFEFAVGDTDNADITTPVTWQIDKIEIYQRREPETAAEPLQTAVTSEAWESTEYENGCGADDSTQLEGAVTDLGGKYIINKVTVDHDSSDIMSWSIMTSEDGVSYTRVTDVYAGGVDKYSGKQVLRFAPVTARYVKYSAVLIGNYYTKAKLNSMKIEYTLPESMAFEGLPSTVNPADTNEIILKTKITEENDEYITSSGVSYSVSGSGASVTGNVLTLDGSEDGQITVTATDMSGDSSATAVIKVVNRPVVNNFVLCGDENYTEPFKSSDTSAYVKAELKACGVSDKNSVTLIAAGYGTDGLLKAVSVTEAAAADGNEISAQLALTSDSAYVKAYVLDKYHSPLCDYVSSDENGISAQNLLITKNSSVPVSVNGENIVWVSADESIASAEDNEIKAVSTGKTEISAYSGDTLAAKITVEVVPTAYVFLMMGQSNMSGTNNPVTEGYTELPVSDNVMLLNNENKFEPATHKYSRYSQITWSESYHDYNGVASLSGGINMGYSFAEDWADDNPDSTIGLIVNSQSGCSIDIYEQVSDDENANGYVNTIERVTAALADGGELAGIIWHQGESNMNNADYHARFRNVMYDFRLAFDALEVPVIAGGLSEDNISTSGHNAKSAAQKDYIAAYGFASSTEPEMIPSRYAVGCYSGNEADYVHFSAKGQLEFGHRYYKAYMQVLNKEKNK